MHSDGDSVRKRKRMLLSATKMKERAVAQTFKVPHFDNFRVSSAASILLVYVHLWGENAPATLVQMSKYLQHVGYCCYPLKDAQLKCK